jgi:hypothetical protein
MPLHQERHARLRNGSRLSIQLTKTTMLSPGILQMLDQVRSEFGVEVEIVDANLAENWPLAGDAPARMLAGPELRTLGLGVLREGRTTVVSIEGRQYRLVPLRNQRSATPTALLAMRIAAQDRAAGQRQASETEAWVEVLRGTIEADLSMRDEIDGERRQARAVRGALRFVTYLASAKTQRELAEGAIQAAAVWFDADARVYRRRPDGEWSLVAWLPGAQIPTDGRALPESTFGAAPLVRPSAVAGLPGGRDGLVVPLSTTEAAEWVLLLVGPIPPDADVMVDALGRVVGLQIERLAQARDTALRAAFEERLRIERPVELTALDLLRELVLRASGTGAALWIQHGEDLRRLASVGTNANPVAGPLLDEWRCGGTLQVRSIDLGANRLARLELRTAPDAPFDADAPAVVDALIGVLRGWLPGAVRPMPQAGASLPSMVAGFAKRIEEELARAKRFDRDLSLVVVESGVLPWHEESVDRVFDVLRSELRGSDVLGLVGERRVVVLLVETNRSAVGTVVGRLRTRLCQVIPELKLPTLLLGQAALSKECATADALLSQAAINAEAIKVPA